MSVVDDPGAYWADLTVAEKGVSAAVALFGLVLLPPCARIIRG
jgi:hypothetical protein